MKKYLIMATAALLTAAPVYIAYQANAQDATAEAAAVETVEAKLADGTVVHIKGDNVFVVDAHGAEVAAPDGEHTLEDGTKIKTAGGVVVKDEAPAAEGHMEEGAAQ